MFWWNKYFDVPTGRLTSPTWSSLTDSNSPLTATPVQRVDAVAPASEVVQPSEVALVVAEVQVVLDTAQASLAAAFHRSMDQSTDRDRNRTFPRLSVSELTSKMMFLSSAINSNILFVPKTAVSHFYETVELNRNCRQSTPRYVVQSAATGVSSALHSVTLRSVAVSHRGGSISPWPISVRYRHCRYRYFWPKISAISISISFTAALFGLLIYFIIASKV